MNWLFRAGVICIGAYFLGRGLFYAFLFGAAIYLRARGHAI